MEIVAPGPDDVVSDLSRELAAAPRWQQSLRQAIRDPAELCRLLGLPESLLPDALRAARQFPLLVPREYVARMRPGDPHDPLLRQVLPLGDELTPVAGFIADPVDDAAALRGPGLLAKYRTRVLMVTTGACAVHCRYCFRRHYPYEEVPRGMAEWEPALAEIADDGSIDEVILSGGDPLTLRDERLAALAERLAAIPHMQRLRVHTRLPIVIPSRVCDELLGWLRGTRLTPIVVVHANHPAELDGATGAALGRLVDAGVPVLNQAVLLAGVNDDVEVLAELSRRLVDLRVMPYYLHQLDRVAGAAHFEVAADLGVALVEQLRGMLPGYAVPRYVQEVAGAESKVVIK
ncbi:MAG: EF-P beta-lysylation protein EpmB [Planctomycetia bacterium]|nr:EF-P beta-lysylation protein EpmB [Planctomycetia bacterium]